MSEPDARDVAAPFLVLVVCTANRYRSPAGEHLLRRAAIAAGLPWEVRSAGTRAVPGQPIDADTAAVLAPRGNVSSGWRTTRLNAREIERADLVLVAADEHRKQVVTMVPAALHRTFPLLQFARLAEAAGRDGLPLHDGAVLLERARRARARVQPAPPGADDIPDPVAKPARLLPGCVELIEGAVGRIVRVAAASARPR